MKMYCNVFSLGVWLPLLTGYQSRVADSQTAYGDADCLSGLCYFSLRAIQMRITMSFRLICIFIEPMPFYGIHSPFPAEKSNKKEI